MKIVFISNYFSHHQKPLSEQLYALTDGNYRFIETEPMEEDRRNLGWGEEKQPLYVLDSVCLVIIASSSIPNTGLML